MPTGPPEPRIIRPQPGPQEMFLATDADIAIYGGAAFGGKTWALLLGNLRHIDNPDFGAVIFRRASPQITNEGGLWDEAGTLYPLAGGVPRVGSLEWVFPSGAKVGMRHLVHEKTKYDWQGSQIPSLAFDELTHFSESQFWYLLSRNRSGCGVRPYVRAGTNPDAGSWVKRFLAPWVDRRYPDPATSGEVRWMLRVNGVIVWARSRAALVAEHGPESRPKSVTFVRSSIYDNAIGMARDPDYLGNLQAQTPVERARLLGGDWDVCAEGLVYPDLGAWVVEREDWPAAIAGRHYGGIDYGWHNPFGALAATLDGDDVLWVGWERKASHCTLSGHSLALPRAGLPRWFADPAGADQTAELRGGGHDVVPSVHLGQKPLESGIAAVTARGKSGRLRIRGDLGELIDEAGKYRYEKQTEVPVDADNHLLAALRYLVVGLDRGRQADPPPGPTAEELAAKAALEAAAKRAAHRNPENARWWAG